MVDRIGSKPLLIGSAILYGFAGGSGFVLDFLFAILGGRALLGLAVAGIMVVRLLTLIYASALLMQVVFYLIPVQMPFYLQQTTGADATRSGLAIAFSTLFSALASMNYGRIKRQLSHISILALALGLMGLGYIGIGLVGSYWLILAVLIPAGCGLGLLMPNLNVWTATEVPDSLRGRALGGLTTFFFLGQFLSPIVSQPISSVIGLTATYGLAGVVLAVLSSILWTSRKQVCRLVQSSLGQA
ncbi:MAG: MFS transporter [Leptolyngbyaceae cyanobacterium SM1_1_3]|nr:MFS transporter [Leptolyngbyaceae cyanobacterium SM1_1_3]NJN02821.1 MFS transporter [Leptolyngbyaceae cyanobacterium RM1_1_2]NJO10538.1 MFS transporter [Leptolyngbyaceae cyanobacterium SL_1_1]